MSYNYSCSGPPFSVLYLFHCIQIIAISSLIVTVISISIRLVIIFTYSVSHGERGRDKIAMHGIYLVTERYITVRERISEPASSYRKCKLSHAQNPAQHPFGFFRGKMQ